MKIIEGSHSLGNMQLDIYILRLQNNHLQFIFRVHVPNVHHKPSQVLRLFFKNKVCQFLDYTCQIHQLTGLQKHHKQCSLKKNEFIFSWFQKLDVFAGEFCASGDTWEGSVPGSFPTQFFRAPWTSFCDILSRHCSNLNFLENISYCELGVQSHYEVILRSTMASFLRLTLKSTRSQDFNI